MPGRKRKASVTALDTPITRRQSGRVKTTTTLNYEESSVEEDVPSEDEFKNSADDNESAVDEAGEAESGDEYGSDEETLKKKGWTKKKGKGGKWEMVIELPREKDPGDVEYRDESVHPNTLEFLRELKRNNRREWLKFHDAPYRLVLSFHFVFRFE
jgi:hypothetical protein